MARIAGIDLPKDKRVEIGLTYIYGIGRTSANKILAEAGINPDTRAKRPSCARSSATATLWRATSAVTWRWTSSA